MDMSDATNKIEADQIMQKSFIENVKRLCITDFHKEDYSEEQKKLYNAVKLFNDSDEKQSETLLRELLSISCNDEIRNTATELLFSILIWQDRFDELNVLGLPRNNEDAEQIEMYDIRDTDFLLSSELTATDMPKFPLIQPIMTVQINGKSNNLLIDTGAMFTIVTESVAKYRGLVAEEKTVEAEAATEGTVAMQTARIGELILGKSIIKNKRCMIAPDEAFDFSTVGGPKIDGVIGWEIIKHLYWEIDFQNRTVKVRAPIQENVIRNMCCDFYPMLKIVINGDETIIVGFDTGGDTTYFGKSMVGRFPGAEQSERQMAGVGQSEASENKGYVIPKLPISIGGVQLTLSDAFVHSDREYSQARTLILAGGLGSDAAIGKVLIIDYQNRHMSIKY